MHDKKEYLTVGEIANFCRVGRATVHRWVAKNKIKSFKLPSGHTRVESGDFVNFLNEYNMPVPEEFHTANYKRILVVDDDDAVLKSVKDMLEDIDNLNCKIELATGGIQGCLKLGSFKPDVLILDLNMPDLAGLDVANELYHSPSQSSTQVLVITGFADENIFARLKDIGVEKILIKPFNFEDLKKHVLDCCLLS